MFWKRRTSFCKETRRRCARGRWLPDYSPASFDSFATSSNISSRFWERTCPDNLLVLFYLRWCFEWFVCTVLARLRGRQWSEPGLHPYPLLLNPHLLHCYSSFLNWQSLQFNCSNSQYMWAFWCWCGRQQRTVERVGSQRSCSVVHHSSLTTIIQSSTLRIVVH